MIENGSEVLYGAASGFEKALVDVDARRLSATPARLIVENIDPYKVKSGANLAYLAWGYGVTLWESSWTEDWKRQWLAQQNDFKASVGTLKAIRMALAPNAYEIRDVVRPPAGFYASPDLTAEEMDAWVRLMPQIRIKFKRGEAFAGVDEWFADFGVVDESAVGLDDGPILYGRVAVLRRSDGIETPLNIVTETTRTKTGKRITFERYAIPRDDDLGFYAEEDFEGGNSYVVPDDAQRFIYSAQLEETNDRQVTTLSLTPLDSGLTPLSPRFERNSDIGQDGGMAGNVAGEAVGLLLPDNETALLLPGDDGALGLPSLGTLAWASIFAGDGAAGTDYVTEDESATMLADRVYLLDSTVTGPMNAGVSFVGVDRVGMPFKTAEILVDLKSKDSAPAFYEDDNLVGESFATPEDSSHIDRALRAIAAGKALNQTVLASFEAYKPVSFGSVIQESTKAGDWLPALL